MKTLLIAFIICLGCTGLVAVDDADVAQTKAAVRQQMGLTLGKGQEKVQAETDIDPATWYEAGKPHLRMRTRVDGVARVSGSAAIGALPDLRGVSLLNLALFYKGRERPITVIDGDADGIFSLSDTVWFQGRHPVGDTTWLDRYDTTAVYFLTVRSSGVRVRYDQLPFNGALPDGVPAPWVGINERYELDTGFYHLGNSSSDATSTYNTFWAMYEGYYWTNLRALAQSRFLQPLTLYPSSDGSVSISAHVVAGTDAVQQPDNRADLTVDGAGHVFFERDGAGGEVLTSTMPGSSMAVGESLMSLYCPGIPGMVGQPGYYSDVMLDYITITGNILPVLTDGSLRFVTPSQSQQMAIDVLGARTQRVAVLDTTNQQFGINTAATTGSLVVASIAPVNVGNILNPEAPTAMRSFVRIDDATFRVDSSLAFILAYREPGAAAQLFVDVNPASVASKLRALPTGSIVAVIGHASLNDASSATLLSAMQIAHLPMPSETHWVVTGVVNSPPAGDFKSNKDRVALGVVSWLRQAAGKMWSPQLGLYGGDERVLFVNDMISVEDARVEPAHLSNLSGDSSGVDYIYITHKNHRVQTEKLASFRRSFNEVRTRIVDVDDVIDEFGAGQRSPEAIRNYLKHAWQSAPMPKPHYLLLVGNASWDPRIAIPFGNVGSTRADQVPTFGRPSSDYWFGLLDDEFDILFPELIVGRIPAITSEESQAQVDKIIQSDTIAFAPWMRRWQFVGGGSEAEGLCEQYTNMLNDVFQTGVTFLDAPFCMDTSTLCRYTAPANAGFYLRKSIDEGLQWMNYIGHGATNTFDINGWGATELANTGRYGVLATYACQTGSFSNPSTASENVTYVTVPNRGFMAAMGGTGWEVQETVSGLHFGLHNLMREGMRALGELMYTAKLQFALGGAQGVNTVMQYCLLGDPLSRVRMGTEPDPYLRQQDVVIADPDRSTQITDDGGSMIVTAVVQNAGTGTRQALTVRIRRTFEGVTDSVDVVLSDGLCSNAVVRCTLDVAGRIGTHDVVVEIDPEHTLDDRRDNNKYEQSVRVFARTVLPIYPHAYGVISAMAPKPVRVIDPYVDQQSVVTFVISSERDETQVLRRSAQSEVERSGSVVDWHHGVLSNDIVGERWLGIWNTTSTGARSATLWLPITVSSDTLSYGQLIQTSTSYRTNEPLSVAIDSVRGLIALRADTHGIYIQSSAIQTSDLEHNPTLIVRVAQTEILRNSYLRGINIVVLPPGDTIPRAVRRYDTWKFPSPIESGHDGFAEDCIKFIRDSIRASDRVLFAACDESFTQFEDRNLLEALRILLKGLGSRYADSLRANSSWAMIGQRGLATGTAQELWKGAPDSMAKLTGSLAFFADSGHAYSEWLGPARRFKMLVATGPKDSPLGQQVTATLYLRRHTGVTDSATLTLPSLVEFTKPNDYEFARVVLNLKHDGGPIPTETEALLQIQYEPADEWIVEASDGFSIPPDSVLRGDSLMATLRVRNARPEQSSYPVALHVSATGQTVTESVFDSNTTINAIPADSVAVVLTRIPTDLLGKPSTVTATVNADEVNAETYAFNNTRTQSANVREDLDTPTIEVRIDDVRATGGDYVYIHPFFDVLMHDNSNLQISDPTKLTVFINGTRIRESTSSEFEFLNTARVYGRYDASDVRAAVRFRYLLEVGQNNILVRARDATGNSGSYEVSVFTATHVEVADVTPYPNPSAGPVTFQTVLADTLPTRPAILEIYDLRGQRIRTLSAVLTVGRGTFEWDGRGEGGESVATGLYMWKLSAIDLGREPLSYRTGTLTVLR